MAGTIKWNLIAAIVGMFFVFFLSLPSNVWQTSIIRGALSFLFFFLFMFIIRVLGAYISQTPSKETRAGMKSSGESLSTDGADPVGKETSEVIRSLLNEDESK